MCPVIPKTKWEAIRLIDRRAANRESGTCQRCGKENLRFVHTLENQFGRQTEVGSECAKRMCLGYLPELEENRLKNRWNRRTRWLLRDWRTSAKGNSTLKFKIAGERLRVTVFTDNVGDWTYCIDVQGTPVFSPRKFASADAAKLGAFDQIAEAEGE